LFLLPDENLKGFSEWLTRWQSFILLGLISTVPSCQEEDTLCVIVHAGLQQYHTKYLLPNIFTTGR